MSGTYFIILAVLVAAGFLLGRQRASGMRGTRVNALHSLPTYHGLYIAAAVLTAMMVIFIIGAPLGSRYIESQALGAFDPSAVADQLQRDAALRDVQNLVAGFYQGEPSEQLKAAAAAYSSAYNLVY